MKIEELLQAARAGDIDAKNQLFELYRPYLKRIAVGELKRQVSTRFNDSDVVQDTCLLATKGLQEFAGQSEPEFTRWLRTILERRVVELHRHNAAEMRDVRREVPRMLSAKDSASVHWLDPIDKERSPGSHVIEGEKALLLLHALDSLPEHQRQAVEMRYLQHRKLKDIAEAMDRTVGSVAGLIRNGLATLELKLPDLQSS